MLHDEYVKYEDQIVRARREGNHKKYGHFHEIQFTKQEWMQINDLNQELKVRYLI